MNMKFDTLSAKAEFYARNCHRSTNHQYDEHPYEFHLQMVVDNVRKWSHLLPTEDRDLAEAGAWVHDVIEDTRQTFNDVKSAVHPAVAELAYALTQEKGRNRAERESERYFAGIREAGPVAVFVKLCDRMANVQHAVSIGHGMGRKYAKDMGHFLSSLWSRDVDALMPMFVTLSTMVSPPVAWDPSHKPEAPPPAPRPAGKLTFVAVK